MADPKAFKELIRIPALKGMQSNVPQGVPVEQVWRPFYLENADFSRSPGWQNQPASTLITPGVDLALSSGIGDDLFIRSGAAFAYFNASTFVATPITGVTNPATAINLMPGLAMTTQVTGGTTYSNQYVLSTGVLQPAGLVPPANYTVTFPATNTGQVLFNHNKSYQFVVILNYSKLPAYPYFPGAQYAMFTLTAGAAGTPTTDYVVQFTYMDASVIGKAYWREVGNAVDWQIGGYITGNGQQSYPQTPILIQANNVLNDPVSVAALNKAAFVDYFTLNTDASTPAAYHQSRVWLAGASYNYFSSDKANNGISTDGASNRLIYSEVISMASAKSLPQFNVSNFIDVPFRVSRKIIAIKSVGRYLYVFGERELCILTGNSDKDFQIESLGDSIGAISAGSVQRLANSVYWLSDSGVMKAEGGSVSEIGTDIRPNLQALNPAAVSSTVDFGKEVYFIGDTTRQYCYYAREDSWTARNDGVSTSLVYGGGTPYSIGTSNLYAINGKKNSAGVFPGYLPILAQFSPHEFDGWHTRKTFRQVLFGYESLYTGQSTLTAFTDETSSTATINHALPPVPHSSKLTTGFLMSGYQFGFSLFVSASATGPVLLRPPLSVMGELKSEQG